MFCWKIVIFCLSVVFIVYFVGIDDAIPLKRRFSKSEVGCCRNVSFFVGAGQVEMCVGSAMCLNFVFCVLNWEHEQSVICVWHFIIHKIHSSWDWCVIFLSGTPTNKCPPVIDSVLLRNFSYFLLFLSLSFLELTMR